MADRTLPATLGAGVLAAVLAVGYGLATGLVRPPGAEGVPFGALLVGATLVVVPFAVGAGVAYLAARHRVVSPLSLGAVAVAAPAVAGPTGDEVLVGVLVVGPLLAVAAVAEALARARLGRLRNPPGEAGYRALSVGVMAAVVYFGVFAVRAVLPLWRLETGTPEAFPPAVRLAVLLWYVLGVSLVLVGLPVALNRRFGLLAPLAGLLAYLLADLAFLQPLVAEGAELVVVLLLAVWPLLSAAFAGVGALEWWLRARRGDYEGGDEGDDGDDELTVEGGLFGDRV